LAHATQTTLLRRRQVEARTGLARSTIYKMVSEGSFPAPIKITGKAVAWPSDAVDDWVTARISASTKVG